MIIIYRHIVQTVSDHVQPMHTPHRVHLACSMPGALRSPTRSRGRSSRHEQEAFMPEKDRTKLTVDALASSLSFLWVAQR